MNKNDSPSQLASRPTEEETTQDFPHEEYNAICIHQRLLTEWESRIVFTLLIHNGFSVYVRLLEHVSFYTCLFLPFPSSRTITMSSEWSPPFAPDHSYQFISCPCMLFHPRTLSDSEDAKQYSSYCTVGNLALTSETETSAWNISYTETFANE